VGWVVPFGTPIVLVSDTTLVHEYAVRQLIRIGYDDLPGYLDGGLEAWERAGLPVARADRLTMRELRERLETAIVLITHNLGVVADIADRVIVMYAGRKAEEAPVRELFAHPQHPYTIGLLGAIPRPGEVLEHDGRRRLQEIPGRVPSLAELPGHCAFAERCPRADGLSRSEVPELRAVRPNHFVACFHPGEDGRP
jgi:oligopeptide/dipeptide ABC transporter ATP-binding protein